MVINGERIIVSLAIRGCNKWSIVWRSWNISSLIDEEINGVKNFLLLVNTNKAGSKGGEDKHAVEYCWYILSGRGTHILIEKAFRVKPEMVIFTTPELEKFLKQKEVDAFKA